MEIKKETGPLALLRRLGYTLQESAQGIIRECESWYRNNEVTKHRRETVQGEKYTMFHMGFGKRVCSDDASLCEVLEVNAGDADTAQFDAVNALLEANRFLPQFRRQLELCAALGTEACYVRQAGADVLEASDGTQSLKGGETELVYVDATGFFPLTVRNGEVLEAAFVGADLTNGKESTTLVICTLVHGSNRYQYRTVTFDEQGAVVSDDAVELGEVKPFAVLRTSAVNHIPGMRGYGLPKLSETIPILLSLDMVFTAMFGDIDESEKITIINEALCGFEKNGDPIPPSKQMKKRFIILGDKLPEKNTFVHEIVPTLRVKEFTELLELLLSLLSMQFGYGMRKYRFENGQITTATEYAGERQDQMQELNKQREIARKYIADIVRAALWFQNTFGGTSWDIDVPVLVEFDDSYVTDRKSELEDMRDDVLAGIGGDNVLSLYLQQRYNLTEDEATEWIRGAPKEETPEDDEEA